MSDEFKIFPVGVIRKTDTAVRIDIAEKYAEALLGLEGFSGETFGRRPLSRGPHWRTASPPGHSGHSPLIGRFAGIDSAADALRIIGH